MTWEYLATQALGGTTKELQVALDAAGADGFELVTCENFKTYWVLVFKRPAGRVPG